MFRGSGPRARRPATPRSPQAHDVARRETVLLRSVQLLLATADPGRVSPADRRERAERRRAEILRYLELQGGALTDAHGLVTRHLRLALGAGPGLARLLQAMEREGSIAREVRGRRTYAVRLLGAAPTVAAPLASRPAADFGEFARALLVILETRLAAVDPDNRARVEQLEGYRATLQRDLADFEALGAEPHGPDADERAAFFRRKLEVMTARVGAFEQRTGFRVGDALTQREGLALRRLLEAPTSTPA